MKCKSIIEIEKELRKEKHEKKRDLLSRLPHPGQKGTPLLSRTGVPGWETGTTAVSQPGQINVFVVVLTPKTVEALICLQDWTRASGTLSFQSLALHDLE